MVMRSGWKSEPQQGKSRLNMSWLFENGGAVRSLELAEEEE